jgi:hypothetical protein
MPYAMQLASASYNGGHGGDFSATIAINVYDATGWTRNPDGSYQAPAVLPDRPFTTAQIVVHGVDSDEAALAAADRAAWAQIQEQLGEAVFEQRIARFRGVFLPVSED